MTTAKTREMRAELLEAVALLKMLGADEDARVLHLDVVNAGHDLRELLMVQEDAERLMQEATFN